MKTKEHEEMIARANALGCRIEEDTPRKREEIKRIVDNLNEFYADHGRMPNLTELDVTLGAGGKVELPKELTYEPIDGE